MLAEWKKLDEQARVAEQSLRERYSAFLDGRGPEPTEWERQQAHMMGQKARAQLKTALDYVAKTTHIRERPSS
jgi:hypothetical protein